MDDGDVDTSHERGSPIITWILVVVVVVIVGGFAYKILGHSSGPATYAPTTGQPPHTSTLSGSRGSWHWTVTVNNALYGSAGPPPTAELCLRLNGNWFRTTTTFNCQFGPLPDGTNLGVIRSFPDNATLIVGPAPPGTATVAFYYFRNLTTGRTSCTPQTGLDSPRLTVSVPTQPLPQGTESGRLFAITLPANNHCTYNVQFLSHDGTVIRPLIF
jgi:hypothetical protein